MKYSSDIHTPKHNYVVINIADETVWRRNFYLVMVFEYIDSGFCLEKCLLIGLSDLSDQCSLFSQWNTISFNGCRWPDAERTEHNPEY